MPINALIARGIDPIGEGLPQTIAAVEQIQQGRNRNALAQQGMALDQSRNALYGRQIGMQENAQKVAADSLKEQRRHEWSATAIAHLRQNPGMSAQIIGEGKQLGFVPAQVPDQLSPEQIEAVAAKMGIAPAQHFAGSVDQEKADYENKNRIGQIQETGRQARLTATTRVDAPKGPNWQRTEQTLSDGRVQVGYVDTNSATPESTFRPLGSPSNAVKDPKLTEGERTAANYLMRMEAAEPHLGTYRPSTKDYILFSRALNSGDGLAALANSGITPEGQRFFQAATDWSRAKLRKESGASISPAEIIGEVRNYFPVPNDDDTNIAQKEAGRKTAVKGMRLMAGGAGSQVDTPKSIKRTGMHAGRKVVEYSDGTIDYAD